MQISVFLALGAEFYGRLAVSGSVLVRVNAMHRHWFAFVAGFIIAR